MFQPLSRILLLLAALALGGSSRAQSTERVSVDSNGAQANDSSSLAPAISPDGRYVVFATRASNLVPNDTNGFMDIFLHDRTTGSTERVNVSSSGAEENGGHPFPRVSISADGRYVAFDGAGDNLVPGDTNAAGDVFVRDRQLGTTERVSVDSGGMEGNGLSLYSTMSADGRYVAFASAATNLVPGDTNSYDDVFVHDRQTGTTERVSIATGGAQGDRESRQSSISADGRYVAFESLATNFVAGDAPFSWDIFVRDRLTGTTELVSVALGGGPPNSGGLFPAISADGRYVAFTSGSANVPGDTNGVDDIFLRDLQAGTTERVSLASGGVQSDFYSRSSAVSADGRFVAFQSQAANLVPGDTNGVPDIFVRDRALWITERVNVSSAGTQANLGSNDPGVQGISADGRYVAFSSGASNLVPGDTNSRPDIFVRDRGPGGTVASFCFGDGTAADCPCSNSGAAGHGCENSAGTGGAVLSATGNSSLSSDTLVFTTSGERATAFSIVLQGDAVIATSFFGDGLRCTGGAIKRLYRKNAVGGAISAPEPGDPSISAQSAALGAPIQPGTSRVYQVYYRDPVTTYCPAPTGGTFNATNAVGVLWTS